MGEITYGVLGPSDVEETLSFWRNTPGVHLHENGEDTIKGIMDYLLRNPNCSFVAKSDDRIIGAVLAGHDGRRCFINHLGVDVSYRRQKIATNLLSLVQNEMSRNGIKKCALFVLKDNVDGEVFYKALGWKEETIVKTFSKII